MTSITPPTGWTLETNGPGAGACSAFRCDRGDGVYALITEHGESIAPRRESAECLVGLYNAEDERLWSARFRSVSEAVAIFGGIPAQAKLSLEAIRPKSRPDTGRWYRGALGPYSFEALIFPERSAWGIEGGRVSKLGIMPRGHSWADCLFNFDRGLDFDLLPEGVALEIARILDAEIARREALAREL